MPNGKSSGRSAGGAGIARRVTELAAPLAEQLGLILWDVRFLKEGADWILRVIIDREDSPVSINDCVDLTHLLNPVLDEADPIPQSYCLEVTSPGADRELTRPAHFERYRDLPVTLHLYRPDESGQREIACLLGEVTDAAVAYRDEDGNDHTVDRKAVSRIQALDLWDDDPEES